MAPQTQDLDLFKSIERIDRLLWQMATRGLKTAGPGDLSQLAMLEIEFVEMGAAHIASLIRTLHASASSGSRASSGDLLLLWANLRVLSRLLARETARPDLETMVRERETWT